MKSCATGVLQENNRIVGAVEDLQQVEAGKVERREPVETAIKVFEAGKCGFLEVSEAGAVAIKGDDVSVQGRVLIPRPKTEGPARLEKYLRSGADQRCAVGELEGGKHRRGIGFEHSTALLPLTKSSNKVLENCPGKSTPVLKYAFSLGKHAILTCGVGKSQQIANMNIDVQEQDREALRQLMAHAEIYATQAMRNNGQVPATLFIKGLEGPLMLRPPSFTDDKSKDRFAALARLTCVAHGATATVLVAESWLKMAKPGKRLDLSIPPSESPDRQEVLIFMGETRRGGCQKFLPILRDGSGRFLGFGAAPTIDCDEVKGRFAQFLPEHYPDLDVQREARELLNRAVHDRERGRREERGFAM